MSQAMTRRQFVRAAGVLAGGVALAGLGPVGCAGQDGTPSGAVAPSATYGGDEGVDKRILVGYATRTGSTSEVAEAIGQTLAARGFAVDVKPLKERPSLDGYDACVLGGAVNGGQWLPEAVQFVDANSARLAQLPTAVFYVHMMNAGDDAKQRRRRLAYLDKVRALVTPTDEAFFLGKGPSADDTSLIARWAFKAFGGAGEGDCRDWDAIRGWAQGVRV
jgi:menaquinone-dependent protoporphyrinogen oxidase